MLCVSAYKNPEGIRSDRGSLHQTQLQLPTTDMRAKSSDPGQIPAHSEPQAPREAGLVVLSAEAVTATEINTL